MCGIAGLFNYISSFSEPGAVEAVLRGMTSSLVHRGPDADGIWVDDKRRCILGHRRLSIIDTSDAGRQPMVSASGRWVIVFNGEIYNFLEIRSLLEGQGARFSGRVDTEVLLEAIAHWGTDALDKLDGMFAFAAFDTLSGELILARDAFGEKPLYWMDLPGDGLAFASELQALERLPCFDAEVSLDAVAEVLMFQYIGAPRTVYRAVRKLPPGHWMRVVPGQPGKSGRFFEFRPGVGGFDTRPMADLADELEEILIRSIRRRLISDVPLGAFLSGGIDSSTVCALIRQKLGLPLKTFSVGFRRAPESEHKSARRFARHIGSEHHDQILSPDTSAFLADIGSVLDEPNGDSSCMPTFLLSEFTRRKVTVAVSGDGGDEMFAGYGRYFHTLEDESSPTRPRPWNPGRAYYSERILVFTERHIQELFGAVPDQLERHLTALRSELEDTSLPLFCHLRQTDVQNYMPGAVLAKVDRMSMQHSLEVRTPFLNIELARFAEKMPQHVLYRDGQGKRLLREVAYRYLPRDLVDAPKKGFGIPMSNWGRSAMLGLASRLLEGDESRLRGALGSEAINQFLVRQKSENGFSTYQVWSLVMLESWLRFHPAKLERMTEALRANRSKRQAPDHGERKVLLAWPIGEKEYRVIEGDRGGESTECESTPVPDGATPLPLPHWGDPVREDQVERYAALDGAKLAFNDIDHARRIDRAELEKYSGLGVSEIEYPHPHLPAGTIVRIRIQPKSPLRRVTAALHLRPRMRGRLGWVRRMRYVWRAVHGRLDDGRRFAFGPLKDAHCETDQEMSHAFVLFEGLRQLPPTPVMHTEIAEKGNGRYSIWNGVAIFSPTRLRRLATHSYWIVKRTPETEPYLEYVCSILKPDPVNLWQLAEILEERFRTNTGSGKAAASASDGPIVVFTHGLPPGGAERQWCYLAVALQECGEQVVFVSLYDLVGDYAHYRPILLENDIPIIELGKQRLPDLLRSSIFDRRTSELLLHGAGPFESGHLLRLVSLLRTLRPKAVLAQLDYPNLLAATAAELADVPRAVMSFRNYNPSHFPYLHNDWFQRYYRALATSRRVAFTGNSRDANDDYANWLGIDPERVVYIPNAVDTAYAKPPVEAEVAALRGELGLHSKVPVVLGVFRLSAEKRPLLFIEVCARLQTLFPQLRVLIAGMGPMEGAMKEAIGRAGLDACTTLLGRREDVPALMTVSSVLLLTSGKEGMPNVAMEAQCIGLPVVAANVGGVPEVVDDGTTGFLVEGEDPGSFVEACRQILDDETHAKEMGVKGASRMRRLFTKAEMAKRYARVIAADVSHRQESLAHRAADKAGFSSTQSDSV